MRILILGLLASAVLCAPHAAVADDEIPAAVSANAHANLCDALLSKGPDLSAVRRTLERGANPNATCSVAYTRRKLHAAGAIMSLVTGGLWLLTPILDEDLLTEAKVEYRQVAPLRLAADLRDPALMGLLIEWGAGIGTLDGAFQDAAEGGDLTWASHLAELGAERRLTHLPPAAFEGGTIAQLLALEPDLTGLDITWTEAAGERFGADHSVLDELLAAGMPVSALEGAFDVAVTHDQLEWAEGLAERGAGRQVGDVPAATLADERRMQRLLTLNPDLSPARLSVDEVRGGLATNPVLAAQLAEGGFDLVDLGFDLLAVRDLEGLDELIEAGMDPGQPTERRHGGTLLSRAVSDGDAEMVAFLLERGAVPRQHGDYHPVDEAAYQGRLDLVEMLMTALPPGRAAPRWEAVLTIGVDSGNPDVMAAALPRVAANRPEKIDELAFDAACRGQATSIETLLIHSVRPQRSAQRALHGAAANGYADMIPLLAAHGADPDARDPGGSAAIHLALQDTWEDQGTVVAALAAAGADLEILSADGLRPLETALRQHNLANIKALLEGGADPNAPLEDGRTPLRRTLERDQWEAAEALLAAGAAVDRATIRRSVASPSGAPPPVAVVQAMADAEPRSGPVFWRSQARWASFYGAPPELVELLEREAERRRQARRDRANTP